MEWLVFGGKIWIVGGYDGKNYLNDVWNSSDGVHWERVAETAPWSARKPSVFTVFNGEMWLLGGGVIDGDVETNPTSEREVWATKDGKHWLPRNGRPQSKMARHPRCVRWETLARWCEPRRDVRKCGMDDGGRNKVEGTRRAVVASRGRFGVGVW